MVKIMLYIKNHLILLSKKNISLSLQFQKAKTRIKLTIQDNNRSKTKLIHRRNVLDTK